MDLNRDENVKLQPNALNPYVNPDGIFELSSKGQVGMSNCVGRFLIFSPQADVGRSLLDVFTRLHALLNRRLEAVLGANLDQGYEYSEDIDRQYNAQFKVLNFILFLPLKVTEQ